MPLNEEIKLHQQKTVAMYMINYNALCNRITVVKDLL